MSRFRLGLVCVLLAAGVPWPAKALQCAGSNLTYNETGDTGASYSICSTLGRCEKPLVLSVAYSFDSPGCNPQSTTCGMTATVTMEFPGNHQNDPAPSGFTYSFAQVQLLGSGGGLVGQCGFAGQVIQEDLGTAVVTAGVTCANPGASHYTLNLTSCPGFSCGKTTAVELDFPLYAGCSPPPPPPPRKDPCDSCLGCIQAGSPGGGAGCGSSAGGGGPACAPSQSGPGARLHYAAGGAGGPGFPGSSGTNPWQTTLGRYWSHDYAQRIVRDPDNSHVWLIKPDGTFQEFSNLASTPGIYTTKSPTDEYRRLFLESATGGWQLIGLDKVVHYFLPSGLWTKTTSSKDPAHPIQGTYNTNSQLVAVSFPDGRSETFTYHPGGKLASITEVGVGGSPTRTWSYFWIGDDLQTIQRPDGTNWEFRYDDPARPGYLTRVDLTVGGAGRVEAAFEYDAFGNVARSWRGDPLFTGPNAIDRRQFAYGNAALPLTASVTDALGNQTRYAVGRDSISPKPKVLAVEGPCSTCGLAPSTRLEYAAVHPLLPSGIVDGKGTRTAFTYNANGRVLTQTEASGTSLQRRTTWTWDPNNLASPISIEQPSTAGGTNVRRLSLNYHGFSGVLLHRTQLGVEWGGQFSFQTAYTYNASGEVVSINPPAFGVSGAPPDNADIVTFTYNLPGRNGHVPDSTTNLVGTTLFAYDAFNRRTGVTDPNGVQTTTAYDALNRVTEVREKGATAADDLVTTFTFTAFKDLACVQLPAGNGREYVYDAAGRLVEERRKANCNPATQALERTVYQYDAMSHRTAADRQRWSVGAWVSDSRTEYAYSCHLDRVTAGAGSPAPSVIEYCYDVNENLEKVWDPNRPRVTHPDPSVLHEYDALDRVIRTTTGAGTPLAASTAYTYDVQDHLKTVADAEGNVTTYTVSDRDVLTRQESPISGRTNYTHDGHGNMVSESDGVTAPPFRSWRLYFDAVDRVTSIDFPAPYDALDTTLVYDGGAFAKGRLASLSRTDSTIAYAYDRFGRVTADGTLQYAYDKNGNRTRVTYLSGVVATYTYDLADRDATLSIQVGGGAPQPIVASAGYRAFGPLATLTLGNGLVEQRNFTPSVFPSRVEVPGRIDWQYTTDAAGNPVAIAGTMLGQAFSSAFSYQAVQHFLTAASGPWGSRSWTYDKVGNRLSEANGGDVTAYTYLLNATGGRTSRLQRVEPAPGGEPSSFQQYGYDVTGILTSVFAAQGEDPGSGKTTTLTADGERHLSALGSSGGQTTLSYDGRGFLRKSRLTFAGSNDFEQTEPTYGSDGLLLSKTYHKQYTRGGRGDGGGGTTTPVILNTTDIFYFADRPVAQLTRPQAGGSADDLLYLTTDHLGTPILATDQAGTGVWAGGVEPFGAFLSVGTPPGDGDGDATSPPGGPSSAAQLASDRIFLRYPGQWDDPTWRSHGLRGGLYYNLNRWYEPLTGRYTQPDPLGDLPVTELLHSPEADPELFSPLYSYVGDNPLSYIDPLGLVRYNGCTQDQQNEIGPALKDYCEKVKTPEFTGCMCEKPSIPGGLQRKCSNPHLVVRCKKDSGGNCEGACGWSRPFFGRSIRLCPVAWNPGRCGPLGCTLMHEMTHQIGHSAETQPDKVEACLGCP